MDSSSDESFIWSKASTGSDDSDTIREALNHGESDDDTCVKLASSSKQEAQEYSDEPKKQLKHKKKSLQSDELDSPRKKGMKAEPESDSDAANKKNKKKHKVILTNGVFHESNTEEDNYLNIRVKQEKEQHHETFNEKHRNKKKSETNSDNEDNDDELKTKKKTKQSKYINGYEESAVNNGQYNHADEDSAEVNRKRLKKKKRKDRVCDQEELNELALEEQSTYKEKDLSIINRQVNRESETEQDTVENHHSHFSENNMEMTKKEINTCSNDATETSELNISAARESSNKATAVTAPQRRPRLSDRIKFEDEMNPNTPSESHLICQGVSSHLKEFLKENTNLQPVSKNLNKDLKITDEDEIWILKCPHDIDVNKLINSEVTLDSKSKMKINGETFCGHLDNSTKINIISSTENKYTIKNLVLNGAIHFRKRLPKPHYHEDNMMVNNQTDFIPLPPTKCRHPLFGPNYKDIINVPIKHCNSGNSPFSSEKKKKKKHKNANDAVTELQPKIECDPEDSYKRSPKIEFDTGRKSKKRKQRNFEEDARRKSKKIKLEPDSIEAWESEKAIEDNLFNF